MNKSIMFGTVKAVDSAVDGPGEFHVILSAPTEDRDNEVVASKAFDTPEYPLPDHITFDADHAMSVKGTVGSGRPYYAADGALHVEGTYTSLPQGQEVRTLVNEGHIKTVSVAYMNAKSKKGEDGVLHTEAAELLNGAFVAVPSNREAVILSSKALARTKVGARNNASDKELIQAMHDHTHTLGAVHTDDAVTGTDAAAEKAHVKAIRARSQKAIAGSYEELRAQLTDALEDAYPKDPLRPYAGSPWVYATFPDHVIYCVWVEDYETQYYQVDYTLNSDGSVAFGTSTPVDIVEIVQPDTDEAADAASDAAAALPAVTTAAASAAAVVEQEQAAARARIRLRRHAARNRAPAHP